MLRTRQRQGGLRESQYVLTRRRYSIRRNYFLASLSDPCQRLQRRDCRYQWIAARWLRTVKAKPSPQPAGHEKTKMISLMNSETFLAKTELDVWNRKK